MKSNRQNNVGYLSIYVANFYLVLGRIPPPPLFFEEAPSSDTFLYNELYVVTLTVLLGVVLFLTIYAVYKKRR